MKWKLPAYIIQSLHLLIPLCYTYASGLYLFLETNLVTQKENWMIFLVLFCSTAIGIVTHLLLGYLYKKRIGIESN